MASHQEQPTTTSHKPPYQAWKRVTSLVKTTDALQNLLHEAESRSREDKWVIHIKDRLKEPEEEEEQHNEVKVSIFNVPKSLLSSKPEAYIPQFIALGPHHHWSAELYEMEEYKISNARAIEKQLPGKSFHKLVDNICSKDYNQFCAHYHRFLDINPDPLKWMMAMDASFLLGLLHVYSEENDKALYQVSFRMSTLMDRERRKSTHNMILRDIIMLENQIPLFWLRKMFQLQSSMAEPDSKLHTMLAGLMTELYPFTMKEKLSFDFTEHPHLLALLYSLIPAPQSSQREYLNFTVVSKIVYSLGFFAAPVRLLAKLPRIMIRILPKFKFSRRNQDQPGTKEVEYEGTENQQPKTESALSSAFRTILAAACKVIFVLKFIPKPFRFAAMFLINLPGFMGISCSRPDSGANRPNQVQEIVIPSVTELISAGVTFKPAAGGLESIRFDAKCGVFYLPTIRLDVNTEVTLRNLVAYEASVALGPLALTRYTELMNGIIDTGEDAKLLGEAGIIQNRLKSSEEVADLWNGMSKSVRLTMVPELDGVIWSVNRYYKARLKVKAREYMKRHFFGTWQFFTTVAAVILLLLTALQCVCTVYMCKL